MKGGAVPVTDPLADDRRSERGMGGRIGRGYSPVAPSMRSRRKSAWPLWRAYSSIMCR